MISPRSWWPVQSFGHAVFFYSAEAPGCYAGGVLGKTTSYVGVLLRKPSYSGLSLEAHHTSNTLVCFMVISLEVVFAIKNFRLYCDGNPELPILLVSGLLTVNFRFAFTSRATITNCGPIVLGISHSLPFELKNYLYISLQSERKKVSQSVFTIIDFKSFAKVKLQVCSPFFFVLCAWEYFLSYTLPFLHFV